MSGGMVAEAPRRVIQGRNGAQMNSSTFTLTASDGIALFVHRWLPNLAPKAAVQIAHGLAEHAGRYARLADALTGAGYAVYAADHRGHGRTAPTREDLGFFAERDGWGKCLDDDLGCKRRGLRAHRGRSRRLLVGRFAGCNRDLQLRAGVRRPLAGWNRRLERPE